jgi:A/G-specific adenine glycosylase
LRANIVLKHLARWYAKEKYRYDFRLARNPYRTWITEIFLQQTQIAAGKEKLKTFLRRFPDVQSLAQGPLDDVLAEFRGMGYYSRARNMHRAAQQIVAAFDGVVPSTYTDLRRISGIGPYTAAMIASIHGGEKILANDANHARVLARLGAIEYPQGSVKFRETAIATARPLFEGNLSAGDVNEALMQWGQMICRKTPLCDRCFAASECAAYAKNEQAYFPVRAARTEPEEILWIMFVHRKANKYQVIESARPFPFLNGELMFPGFVSRAGAKTPDTLPGKIEAELVHQLSQDAQSLPVDFRHAITKYKISVKLLLNRKPLPGGIYLEVSELQIRCHSSLMQKALRCLDKLEF